MPLAAQRSDLTLHAHHTFFPVPVGFHFERKCLAHYRHTAIAWKRRDMDEKFFAALLGHDKPEAAVSVPFFQVPLNRKSDVLPFVSLCARRVIFLTSQCQYEPGRRSRSNFTDCAFRCKRDKLHSPKIRYPR